MEKAEATVISELPSPEVAESPGARRMVMAIAIFSLCIDSMAVRSFSLLAPFIRSSLNLNAVQAGTVMGVLTAGTLLVALPVGRLLDRVNVRRAFPIMLAALGAAFLIVSMQVTLAGLLVSLFCLGALRAGFIPLVNRVVTVRVASGQRGAALGIIYAAVPLGGVIGAVVLPALGESINWQSGYAFLGLLSFIGAIPSYNRIQADAAGRSSPSPVRDRTPLRSKTFLILALTYGIYALSMSADVFIPLFLVDVTKISAWAAGIFFGLIQFSGVGGRVLWGILADRKFRNQRWRLLALVNWLAVGAFLLLTRLDESSGSWLIALVMIVNGMSIASSWGILSTVLGDVVNLRAIAVATSVVFFITNVTDVVGPILYGATLEATGSYQQTIALFMGFAACAASINTWMSWRRRPAPSPAAGG